MVNISIASDHAGFSLKQSILVSLGYKFAFIDKGCNSFESCDYPDYAFSVVEDVLNGNSNFGLLICNTGIGMSISANRFKNIRAALCFNLMMVEKARIHNNANVLCIGSSLIDNNSACNMIEKFINTNFTVGGRHDSRIAKFNNREG